MNSSTNISCVLDKLFKMAASSPRREICGIIASDYEIIPIINIALNGQHFVMQKYGYFRALKKLKDSGREVFAIYHSHPNCNEEPSAADIEASKRTGLNYLIVTPNGKYRWVE